jgi:hypothetical protein
MSMSVTQRSFWLATGIAVIVVFVGIAGLVSLYRSFVVHIMTKTSPDGRHYAQLYRIDGIDRIFKVYVNGNKVFQSADFAPKDVDCREHIAWSSDGQTIVLNVAGERLFAFDVAENRTVTDSEIGSVEFTPFDARGYEADLPAATSDNK